MHQSDTVESVVAYCREHSRVRPLPPKWKSALGELLPSRARIGAGWHPPPPLILAIKQLLHRQIKPMSLWWQSHRRLLRGRAKDASLGRAYCVGRTTWFVNSVARFLRELREEDWFHLHQYIIACFGLYVEQTIRVVRHRQQARR